jgi:hypothetical protein
MLYVRRREKEEQQTQKQKKNDENEPKHLKHQERQPIVLLIIPCDFLTMTNMEDLLVSSLGVQVLEYLRIADIQRLCVCCKTLEGLPTASPAVCAIVRWLKDVEVLYCMKCPETLRQKISRSMKQYPARYRVVEYPNTRIVGRTLYEAMEDNWEECFPTTHYGPYWTAESYGLARNLHRSGELPDQAYEYIGGSERNYDANIPPFKKQRKLECSSRFCQEKRGTYDLLFYVGGTPYCSECISQSNYLKIRFCSEHEVMIDSWWYVAEKKYDDEEQDDGRDEPVFSLGKDEFWVHLFHASPYEDFEFCFIGVGPRD